MTNKENGKMEILISKSLEKTQMGYGFIVDMDKLAVNLKRRNENERN